MAFLYIQGLFKNRLIQKKEQPITEVISSGRRSGRTTRIVDSLVQELFTTGKCQVYDHFGTRNDAIDVFHKVLFRLKHEHEHTYPEVETNEHKLTIYYERNARS